jgi:hypothetical protein
MIEGTYATHTTTASLRLLTFVLSEEPEHALDDKLTIIATNGSLIALTAIPNEGNG